MIKFSFIMSEEDSQNLCDILRGAVCNTLSEAVRATADGSSAKAEWFKQHAEHLRGLVSVVISGSCRDIDGDFTS